MASLFSRTLTRRLSYLDTDYLLSLRNREEILRNLKSRKVSIKDFTDFLNDPSNIDIGLRLPNKIHPLVQFYDAPKEIKNQNRLSLNMKKWKSFTELSKPWLRTSNTGNIAGEKAYYLFGPLSEMEFALIDFVKDRLRKNYGFRLLCVPDILDESILRGCGMKLKDGERKQVYTLANNKVLSGTAENGIAAYYSETNLENPVKVMATSRCFRAEVSKIKSEKGIYRVHYFTKVEMFSVSNESSSDERLDEFLQIQCDLYDELNLSYRTLDMSPDELGDSAYRKYDNEALFPHQNIYGEISSCSNCLDYQSRRLNIKIRNNFAHTVNGTAAAIPRLLMALVEQNQRSDGSLGIPKALQPYMRTQESFNKDFSSNFSLLDFKYIESPYLFFSS